MEIALSYVGQGGKTINDLLKLYGMKEIETGNKHTEFGREKQSEANMSLPENQRYKRVKLKKKPNLE